MNIANLSETLGIHCIERQSASIFRGPFARNITWVDIYTYTLPEQTVGMEAGKTACVINKERITTYLAQANSIIIVSFASIVSFDIE